MKVNTTRKIRYVLEHLGFNLQDFHITRRTKDSDVLDLIHALHPQDCGIELVRIGSPAEGGYLIPNDLAGIEYCFSPGVSKSSDFESHLADLGIKSFLADYSVDKPATARPELTFDKKFLASFDSEKTITLPSWKEKYISDYTGDLILQMDIEGCEYEVLLNTPDNLLDQFRIIIVEFHHLNNFFDPFAFTLFSSCFRKLLQHFHVAHIHPNNFRGTVKFGEIEIPEVMEFTFINKRRVSSTKPQRVFPHKLDVENKATYPPMPLPKCWYT